MRAATCPIAAAALMWGSALAQIEPRPPDQNECDRLVDDYNRLKQRAASATDEQIRERLERQIQELGRDAIPRVCARSSTIPGEELRPPRREAAPRSDIRG
jgi:hypothetical protein